MPATLFLATAAAALLAGCPGSEAPVVEVTNEVSAVEIVHRSVRDMAALYQAASGTAHRVQPLGMTRADTLIDSSYSFRTVSTKAGQICLWPERIRIQVETASTISVTRDVARNSCQWRAVLEHEMRHVEADRTTAWHASLRIRDRMREAAAGYGPFDRTDLHQATGKLVGSLETTLRTAAENMYAVRDGAEGAVDTEQEYARFGARCMSPDLYVVNGPTARGGLRKNAGPETSVVRDD